MLVSSYLTLSPLPDALAYRRGDPLLRQAVCSLLHFPRVAPPGTFPSVLPYGVRTFLDPTEVEPRPPGPLSTTNVIQRRNHPSDKEHDRASDRLRRMNKLVSRWARMGRHLDVGGRSIFVWERGEGRPILTLHGFPSSSRDWWELAGKLEGRRFIGIDFPGFGLSDKSPNGDYSLFSHADIVENVMKQLGIDDCDILAHDLGDTVAAELLARSNEGKLTFRVGHCVLLNGSIFIDMARLTSGQKLLLRMKARRSALPMPIKPFRLQLRRTFANDPPRGTFQTMEALLAHDGGARMLPVTVRYIEERRQHQERWTKALVDFPGPLGVVWGEVDPVAVPQMVDRLVGLRPSTMVVRWPDVGHWPNIEAPERLGTKLGRLLS